MSDYIRRADAIEAVIEEWDGYAKPLDSWDVMNRTRAVLETLPSAEAVSREKYDTVCEEYNRLVHNAICIKLCDENCKYEKGNTCYHAREHYAIDSVLSAEAEQVASKLKKPCESLLTDDSAECKKQRRKLDLISRADAIEAICKKCGGCDEQKEDCWEITAINALPSADAEYDDYRHATLVDIKEPLRASADAVQNDAISKRFISDAILQKISELNAQGEKAIPIAREFIRFKRFVDGLTPIRTEAVQGWIPFKTRPLTDEEKQEYPDWTYIFDCPLPDDDEEILLSNGKYVWTDTFINDGECYLDGGDDIDEGMAWMPMPEPYREDGEA